MPSWRRVILSVLLFGFLPLSTPAASLIPADFRQRTIPVTAPYRVEYSFGGGSRNKIWLNLVNYPGGNSDLFFFHVHANEVTARKAGEDAVRRNGGTLIYFTHGSDDRDVRVSIGGRTYEFDPNRIFTDYGLREKTEPKPSGKALAELRNFVAWVKQNIEIARVQRGRQMIVALHNNTDDDRHGEQLSIRTERKLIGIDNKEVHRGDADIDNFFIATKPATYASMVDALSPNIALRLERPRDIGYLSNWAINQGIDYVTVETEHGDERNNAQMVEDVQRTLW